MPFSRSIARSHASPAVPRLAGPPHPAPRATTPCVRPVAQARYWPAYHRVRRCPVVFSAGGCPQA
eukprot:7366070-Lingulodinium_polyedra.AAC.1